MSVRLFYSLTYVRASLELTIRSPVAISYLKLAGLCETKHDLSEKSPQNVDPTASKLTVNNKICTTPREASRNLIKFLTDSDVQKRSGQITIPFFTSGSYLTVLYADSSSPTGNNKFTGICIARSNKGLGSTFILRNVIDGVGVERMFELYSPHIKEIKVLKLERRRRAKLYYLRDKPAKYSTVKENMEPVQTDKLLKYKRRGAPA